MSIKQSNISHLNCRIERKKENCIDDDIILSDYKINEVYREIFTPHTTFFQNFNNRRTIIIKIVKGKSNFPVTKEIDYYFSFENNAFTCKNYILNAILI